MSEHVGVDPYGAGSGCRPLDRSVPRGSIPCAGTIAVTGSRTANADLELMVRSVLASQRVGLLLHGGASGVDAAAAAWARAAGVEARAFPADWSGGRSAGPARNRRMLREGQPDVLLAFPGGRGTDDCVRAAGELGVPVRDLRDADPYALAEREAIQSVEREEAAWAKLGQRRAS